MVESRLGSIPPVLWLFRNGQTGFNWSGSRSRRVASRRLAFSLSTVVKEIFTTLVDVAGRDSFVVDARSFRKHGISRG